MVICNSFVPNGSPGDTMFAIPIFSGRKWCTAAQLRLLSPLSFGTLYCSAFWASTLLPTTGVLGQPLMPRGCLSRCWQSTHLGKSWAVTHGDQCHLGHLEYGESAGGL